MENGDVLYWCQWCGMRDTMHKEGDYKYDSNIMLDAFADRIKPLSSFDLRSMGNLQMLIEKGKVTR